MNKYELYLHDLGELVKELALEARNNLKNNTHSRDEQLYKEGYLSAMYRVVTLMQQQCIGFDIELKDLSLEDIDPNKDLL